MLYGCAHTKGLYNYPDDGQQFANGCAAIKATGCNVLKVYLTGAYLTDYPEQASWSSTPTTLTTLLQTTQFTTQLTDSHWNTIIFTTFTFANGVTNWWRVEPTNAKLSAEYTEIYNAAVHLLTTYNNSGKTFVFQNWEGDWPLCDDSFDPTALGTRADVDYYSAFLAKRQKAVRDARAATAHRNVTVLNSFECNRVLDAKDNPERRRIVTDIAKRLQPDIISYSAYDSTIVSTGWGDTFAEWQAACEADFTRALTIISEAFPGVPIQIGEFGFPENEHPRDADEVADMIQVVHDVCLNFDVRYFIYWQVFDNEPSVEHTYRGYWFVNAAGEQTVAGAKFEELAGG